MKINPISALSHTNTYRNTCRHIISARKKISNKFSSLFAILHFMCFADVTIFIVNWFFCIFHAQHFTAVAAVDVDYNVQIFFYVFMVNTCARVRVFAFARCELIHTHKHTQQIYIYWISICNVCHPLSLSIPVFHHVTHFHSYFYASIWKFKSGTMLESPNKTRKLNL